MTELKNDRFLRALLKQPVDVTPIWMMRQAGRYLPEYRASRAKAGDFMGLCMNPEMACEVTLQPLERYPLDAAILFSDILTIPDAMGLGLYFETGEGPRFKKIVDTPEAIDALPIPDPVADLEGLGKLALWALQRLSPVVAPDLPDGLVIDTTGADHLHGGEAAMGHG